MAAALSCARADTPGPDPSIRHPHLPDQKRCERKFIASHNATEVKKGPVYLQLAAVARTFGQGNEVPHLYVITIWNTSSEYLPGSRFDKDGRGMIFFSQATITDFTDPKAPSGALEGLLGRQMSYLVADKGRACEIYALKNPTDEQEEIADIGAARYLHKAPVIAFLSWTRKLAEDRGETSPGFELEIDNRIQEVQEDIKPFLQSDLLQ